MSIATESEWLNESEAAEWLGITVRTLSDNVRRGRVPCIKLSNKARRFHKPTLIAMAQPKNRK